MRLKKIKTLIYNPGEEQQLQDLLFKAKEPLLIRINNFPNDFTLDYFQENHHGSTSYTVFDNFRFVENKLGDLNETLEAIKINKPYRIFGQLFSREASSVIEQYIPLWQHLPFTPRFYNASLKVAYFFGGRGSATELHFDREHCCNLHVCLSGKKQILLFTEEQNDYLYKIPYVGDALIDFAEPLKQLQHEYPRLNQATGYQVIIKAGDMVFMPRNCWHYTRYLEPSTSATYVFYTHKLWQFYGYFTGNFFIGYKWYYFPFKVYNLPLFKKFSFAYAKASGLKKLILKLIENLSYIVLLPLLSIATIVTTKFLYLKSFYNKEQ